MRRHAAAQARRAEVGGLSLSPEGTRAQIRFSPEAVARRYASLDYQSTGTKIFISDGAKEIRCRHRRHPRRQPVAIPDPVYPVYADSSILAGRRPHDRREHLENLFLPMPDGIAMESNAVFFICSPNNPTGAVYSRNEKWVDFARDAGSLIIYDSTYRIVHRQRDFPHSIYESTEQNNARSKYAACQNPAGFTGMRCMDGRAVGLSAGDVSLNALWARRQATKFNGVAYYSACRRSRAFRRGRAQCYEGDTIYKGKRAFCPRRLTKKGIFYTGGRSSPYIWMRCPRRHGIRIFRPASRKSADSRNARRGFGSAGLGISNPHSENRRHAEAAERLRALL